MKTIIAATDFSPVSTNAAIYAAEMARTMKAELVLVNVYTIPVTYTDGIVVPVPIDDLRESSEKALENARKIIYEKMFGTVMITTKSRMGNVAEELYDLCKTHEPFAVVIGTRGKTNLEKTIFGTSAYSIIKKLTCPVICVPPGRTYGEGIRKVGLASDFKEVIDTVPSREISEFINTFKAELHILSVDHKDKHFAPETPHEMFVLQDQFTNYQPQYHFIDNPDPEDGLIDYAETHDLDMLISIPKKHTLLEKIFRKPSTQQLINELSIPLLCIHKN
jgi:nucleotide-binding universal stress UspA family protein